MTGKKNHRLDKHRHDSQEQLLEEESAASCQAAAHRGPGKKFGRLDHTRGTSLLNQPRLDPRDPIINRNPDSKTLEELAQIRKLPAASTEKSK